MIRGHTIAYSARNGLITSKPYRWRGIPGWNPANAVAKRKPATWKPPAPCGTLGGYQRHKRNHETPCDPCRDASNAYKRASKKASES